MATIHHSPTPTTAATSCRGRCARRHSLDYSSLPSSSTTTTSLKHTPTISYTSNKKPTLFTLSASATTTPTTSPTSSTSPFSLDTLERHLSEANLRQADEETRRLLIVLAGEAAIKRGYVFFSEVQFIPTQDLKAIDELWMKYSDGRFGYSVQKKLWLKVNKDFTKFFMKVGWMKKLDTEVEQFNYRSFPTEFMWELNGKNDDSNNELNGDNDSVNNVNVNGVPPDGHLPLTNALRGTQLLTMIFSHPAFDEGDDEENRRVDSENGVENLVEEAGSNKKKSRLESLRDRLFKPNYSF